MKIALLCGGISPERDISIASGRKVAEGLRSRGHTVIVIDPAYGADQPDEEEILAPMIGDEPPSFNGTIKETIRRYITTVDTVIPSDTDAVFVILHGTWGEDGRIQGLLELRGFPYTGSGVLASALAMSKPTAKILFEYAGIPTPAWIVLERTTPVDSIKNEIDKKFGYPAVVKPGDQGSTVGLAIIQDASQIENAVAAARKHSDRVLIEAYIPGREMTVSILGEEALPVIEIRPKEGFYDYRNKYLTGRTEYLVPAPLDESVSVRLREYAIKAFKELGCSGFGRVDFRVSDNGDAYCLEVNTLPGMTDTSLVPKAANAVGIGYAVLCEKIVLLALEK